jgi:hypothetical protein
MAEGVLQYGSIALGSRGGVVSIRHLLLLLRLATATGACMASAPSAPVQLPDACRPLAAYG